MNAPVKWIFVAVGFLLLALPAIQLFMPIGFFFEGTLNEHRLWYPSLFWISFFVAQLTFPFLHSIWVGGLWIYGLRRRTVIEILALIIGVSVVDFWVLHHLGFTCITAISIAYMTGGVFFLFQRKWQNVLADNALFRKVFTGTFIGVLYILLCLVVERGHPFAKNTMFNEFPDKTVVFYIEDLQGRLLPLSEYSTIDGNEFVQLHKALNAKHDFSAHAANESEQQIVYDEMVDYLFKHGKKKWPVDSICLVNITFRINGPSWERQRKILGTYHVE